MKTTDKDLQRILQLLHAALLDIRVAAHESGDKKAFHLADLFHTVPLQLARVTSGEQSAKEVLAWIKIRAAEKGCAAWVNAATKPPAPLSKSA